MESPPTNPDAAIAGMCDMLQSMIQANDRSAGALSAAEAVCKSLGLMCATSQASSEVIASGFSMQVRGLEWVHHGVSSP